MIPHESEQRQYGKAVKRHVSRRRPNRCSHWHYIILVKEAGVTAILEKFGQRKVCKRVLYSLQRAVDEFTPEVRKMDMKYHTFLRSSHAQLRFSVIIKG